MKLFGALVFIGAILLATLATICSVLPASFVESLPSWARTMVVTIFIIGIPLHILLGIVALMNLPSRSNSSSAPHDTNMTKTPANPNA